MKRKIFIVALIVICLSLTAYGTMAYFTAGETAHNVITSGQISIDLQEWADEAKTQPFPGDGVTGVMPGAEVTKIVEIKNTGTGDAYIRVKVSKSITLDEDVEGEVDLGLLILDFDQEYWTLGGDGYYYYNVPLAPGKVTEPLFASVTFDVSMGNIYQNSTAAVDVAAYAVQAANNGASVMEAAGWPEETTD